MPPTQPTGRVDSTRVVVIGGGVIGCAILRELAIVGIDAILVEAEQDVGEGTSKSNSGIVHTGFDSRPGSVETRMIRRAADIWPDLLIELGLPALAVGALAIARDSEDARRLRELAANAASLGVQTELLGRSSIRELAPYVTDASVAALLVPHESIIDPFWLTRAFAEAAIANGAEVRLGRSVVGLEPGRGEIRVSLDDSSLIIADQVVDAAGIRADEVARLAGDSSFSIRPRKGEFLVSEETFGIDRIVVPLPGPRGKGSLVTPIVFGGVLLGPTALEVGDKTDRGVGADARDRIVESCAGLVPALRDVVSIRQFAGLRHVSSTGDFILRPSPVSDRLFVAAGIRSTGITTSPAVAEAVVASICELRGWPSARPPSRVPTPEWVVPQESSAVVCLCRSVTRGEVAMACQRPLTPRTLDGVKRRSGAMFGDCQGNLCAVDVAEVVAEVAGIAVDHLEKHARGSWLWLARDGRTEAGARSQRQPTPTRSSWDVIVIGGGRAGLAAAIACSSGGHDVLVIERRAGPKIMDWPGRLPLLGHTTAVGLAHEAGRWHIECQSERDRLDLSASAVIVTTGAYVQPLEHRRSGGSRPAGVMTSDLAARIVEDGLLPGHRVALAGSGARSRQLREALESAGVNVVPLDAAPDEIRGLARLEAVRVGDEWIEADTLVLADTLIRQLFLLRPLGLIDARPGSTAPIDDDGRLPIDGLWAAGCCIEPDLDHQTCGERGGRVGARVAVALGASAPSS